MANRKSPRNPGDQGEPPSQSHSPIGRFPRCPPDWMIPLSNINGPASRSAPSRALRQIWEVSCCEPTKRPWAKDDDGTVDDAVSYSRPVALLPANHSPCITRHIPPPDKTNTACISTLPANSTSTDRLIHACKCSVADERQHRHPYTTTTIRINMYSCTQTLHGITTTPPPTQHHPTPTDARSRHAHRAKF